MDVLLVDDDATVRDTLEQMLAAHGHRVRCAPDVGTALSMVDVTCPDVVLSDIRMPGADGLDLLRNLRGSHPQLPVVLMTGFSESSTTALAFELGVDGFLQKPVRVAELLAGMERLRRE